MLLELATQMKEKGFDIWVSEDGYMAIVRTESYRGNVHVCYIYKSLKVESAKCLDEIQEKELRRVRSFISLFKKKTIIA